MDQLKDKIIQIPQCLEHPTTDAEIAAFIGVHPSSISRFRNEPSKLSDKMIARIEAAFTELGEPLPEIKMQAPERIKAVGCVLSANRDAALLNLAFELAGALETKGYSTLIGQNLVSLNLALRVGEEMQLEPSDPTVILWLGSAPDTGQAKAIRELGVRLVVIADYPLAPCYDSIGFDFRHAGGEAAAFLKRQGTKNALVFDRADHDRRESLRMRAFREGLHQIGIEFETKFVTNDYYKVRAHDLDQMKGVKPFGAVVCLDDEIVSKVALILSEAGFELGNDCEMIVPGIWDPSGPSISMPLAKLFRSEELLFGLYNHIDGLYQLPTKPRFNIDVKSALVPLRGSFR